MIWWDFNPKVKFLAADISRLIYSTIDSSVVIASTGRSGSTMLCRALMSSFIRSKFHLNINPRMVFYPAFQIDSQRVFRKGGVYKTHLLAENIPSEQKTIFIYDDPVVTYKSFHRCVLTYGEEWGAQHLRNLESKYSIKDIQKDVDYLNYEKQVKSWHTREKGTFVRFSDLWEQVDVLSSYIGVKLYLPPQVERASVVNSSEKLNTSLKNLTELYASLPPLICKD